MEHVADNRVRTDPEKVQPAVSIVIPFFNEEENLPILWDELRRTMDSESRSYEVLFVDDGSIDRSLKIVSRLAAHDQRIRLLRLRRNRGQSAALAAGFRAARGAVVVTLDADLQNDPSDIPMLLEQLESTDAVSGVRTRRQDSWVRRLSSRIANRVRDLVIRDSISDVGCSLKAYRAEYLERIPMFHGMHRFLPALVQMEGARVKEIAVRHRPRRYGSTKYGIHNRLWPGLVDLMACRWMQKRWIGRRLMEEVAVWDSKRSGSGSV